MIFSNFAPQIQTMITVLPISISQSDSLQVQSATAPLVVSRQVLNTDSFVIDSSRLQQKTAPAPVVKTVPFIPQNDSVAHPTYDVINNNFVISHDESLMDQLGINPIEPVDAEQKSFATVEIEQPVEEVAQTEQPTALADTTPVAEFELVQAESQTVVEEPALPAQVVTQPEPQPIAEVVDTVAVTDSVALDSCSLLASDTIVAKPRTHTTQDVAILRKVRNISANKLLADADWMLITIIVSFVLFAWVRFTSHRFVQSVRQTVTNIYAAVRFYEEHNLTRGRVFFMLNVLFFINLSLFVCQCFDYYSIAIDGLEGIKLFALLFAIFVILLGLKSFVLAVLELIFQTDGAFGLYNFSMFCCYKLYGMLMLPVVAALPFVSADIAEKLIWVGLGLFAFMYLYSILRGFRIAIKNRASIFYMLLFLCAIEILPLTFILKCISLYR